LWREVSATREIANLLFYFVLWGIVGDCPHELSGRRKETGIYPIYLSIRMDLVYFPIKLETYWFAHD
jgi:hypothetical protein